MSNSDLPLSSKPGDAVRDRGLVRALGPFMGMVGVTGMVLGILLGGWFFPDRISGGFSFGLLCLISLGLVMTWKHSIVVLSRHEAGAEGEEITAEALERLPSGWQVFHDVKIGEFDFDHLVLGPPGVCAVETICWSGRVDVSDGKLLDGGRFYPGYELNTLKRKAHHLQQQLDRSDIPFVTCVSSTSGRLAFAPGVTEGVWIGEAQDLVSYLTHLHSSTDIDVESLAKILKKAAS